MEDVASYLGQRPASTPVIIHCLSDTGCMSFQVIGDSDIQYLDHDLIAGTDNSLRPPGQSSQPSRPRVGQLPGSEAARDNPQGSCPLHHQLAVEDAGRDEPCGGREVKCG